MEYQQLLEALVFWLHPVSSIFFIVVALVSLVLNGTRSRTTRFWKWALIYLAVVYVLGFIALSADPYYEELGTREYIDWGARWGWAFMFASIFEVLLLPLVPLAVICWRKISQRRGKFSHEGKTHQMPGS